MNEKYDSYLTGTGIKKEESLEIVKKLIALLNGIPLASAKDCLKEVDVLISGGVSKVNADMLNQTDLFLDAEPITTQALGISKLSKNEASND